MIKECFKIGTVSFCAVIILSFDKKKRLLVSLV